MQRRPVRPHQIRHRYTRLGCDDVTLDGRRMATPVNSVLGGRECTQAKRTRQGNRISISIERTAYNQFRSILSSSSGANLSDANHDSPARLSVCPSVCPSVCLISFDVALRVDWSQCVIPESKDRFWNETSRANWTYQRTYRENVPEDVRTILRSLVMVAGARVVMSWRTNLPIVNSVIDLVGAVHNNIRTFLIGEFSIMCFLRIILSWSIYQIIFYPYYYY